MKRKGFTLVELLAVIAILAILVIIALPNVMGMFNEAKKNSFATEVKEIYKVAEQQWMNDSMISTNEQVYSRCSSCTGKSLQLTGRNELDYYIKFDKSGRVREYYATDGTYQYRYTGDGLLVQDITDIDTIADLPEGQEMNISFIVNPPQGDPTMGNYFNASTGTYYESLLAAFTAINNNQTIQLLNDVTETATATLPDTKTGIKLDLNGKTLKFNSYYINNKGTLDIYNSSSTTAKINGRSAFMNNGTLTFNGTSNANNISIVFTSSGYILNKGTLELNNKVSLSTSQYDAINISTGSVHINGATIRAGNGYDYDATGIHVSAGTELIVDGSDTTITGVGGSQSGIYNAGTTTINDGVITGTMYGIYNIATLTINNGTIKNDGGSTSYGLNNSGTTTMTNGTIAGSYFGISNTGTMVITGGSISGSTRGINNNGTLTLGDASSPVRTDSPIVHATKTSYGYGFANSSTATFNFYDGIIKSSSGSR